MTEGHYNAYPIPSDYNELFTGDSLNGLTKREYFAVHSSVPPGEYEISNFKNASELTGIPEPIVGDLPSIVDFCTRFEAWVRVKKADALIAALNTTLNPSK